MKCPICERDRPARQMRLVDTGEGYEWFCDLCVRTVEEWVRYAFVVDDEEEDSN